MTLRIRVEHADAASLASAVLEVWSRPLAPSGPDVKVHEFLLSTPADQREVFIDSSRYLVIRERITS